MGEKRNMYRILVGKPERKTTGRPRHRWIDNIKIDLLDRIGCCGLDWSGTGGELL
jgi:hypothetical protein